MNTTAYLNQNASMVMYLLIMNSQHLSRISMTIRNRNLHTISYGKDESDLYAEVNRQSLLQVVAIATLIKEYIRKGMIENQKQVSTSNGAR